LHHRAITPDHTDARKAAVARGVRLIDTDVGWAIRPLVRFQNLEFRVGYDLTADVQRHVARNAVYGAVRLAFDPTGFGLLRR
jgi:hypothetical protein